MSHTRREFVIMSSATLAASQIATSATSEDDRAAESLLAEFAEELLVDYPESATMLGIDAGDRAALKTKLSDRSPTGQQAIEKRIARRLERLKGIDPNGLGPAARVDVDVVRTAHEFALEGFALP